jgi:prepilin-type N-terminal cleavage/methylation domain-containing protein
MKTPKILLNRGFTLIEIIVVIILIAILASLAIPGYRKLMEKAKITEAKTVLTSIVTAEKIYRADSETDVFTKVLGHLTMSFEGFYETGGTTVITSDTNISSLTVVDSKYFKYEVSNTNPLEIKATRINPGPFKGAIITWYETTNGFVFGIGGVESSDNPYVKAGLNK